MDDTQTQTTEHHSASQWHFFVGFFLLYKPPRDNVMASTKSTVEPISLFVLLVCKQIKQQRNIKACKFKYVFFNSFILV